RRPGSAAPFENDVIANQSKLPTALAPGASMTSLASLRPAGNMTGRLIVCQFCHQPVSGTATAPVTFRPSTSRCHVPRGPSVAPSSRVCTRSVCVPVEPNVSGDFASQYAPSCQPHPETPQFEQFSRATRRPDSVLMPNAGAPFTNASLNCSQTESLDFELPA